MTISENNAVYIPEAWNYEYFTFNPQKTIVIKYKIQSQARIYVCRMKRGCIYAMLTAKYALHKTSYSGRINNTEALLPMRKTKTFASRMSYAGEVRNCSAAHSW